MKAKGKRILSAVLALCLVAGLLAVMPVLSSAIDIDVTIEETDTVAGIQGVLQGLIDGLVASAPAELTVGGSKTDADEDLILNIPDGVTVNWLATYEGEADTSALINITGAGTFAVAEGGSVVSTSSFGYAIFSNTAVVTVTDGTVTSAGGCAVCAYDITVSGSTIAGSAGNVLYAGVNAAVSGSTVTVTDGLLTHAVIIAGENVTVTDNSVVTADAGAGIIALNRDVTVTDSTVTTEDGTAIQALSTLTGNGAVTITDSTVSTEYGIAINAAGDVNVTDSLVTSDENGSAIITTGGDVTVTGSTVTTLEGAGWAVRAAGDVDVSGSTLTGGFGIVSTGAGAGAVTVAASTVTATAGAAIQTNTGGVTITSGTVTGKTAGIEAGGAVSIAAGKVEATAGPAVTSRSAGVTVTGGEVKATGGNGITAAGAVAVSGAGKVSASGGTAISAPSWAVTVSDTAAVQGTAVVINCATATISGGSVTGGTTGIYSMGNVLVTGGTVTAGSGTYDRAICSTSGTVVVRGGSVSATTAIDLFGSTGAAAYLAGTCTGAFNVTSHGVVVEVDVNDQALIPASRHDTGTGLTVKSQSHLSSAKWDCTGGDDNPAFINLVIINPVGSPATLSYPIQWGVNVKSAISAGTITRTSDTAAVIGFTTTTGGKAYVVNLSEAANIPSAATIAAGTPLGDVSVGAVTNLSIALNPGRRNVYVVVLDPLGNFTNVLLIEALSFAPSYNVTVNGGTGGGLKLAGATVSIVAGPAPEGKVFDKWTSSDGVIFANAGAASTSFTMLTKDVTVTANYKDAPVKYVGLFGFNTTYVSSGWNWFMFIVLFGWIWMWFL